MAQASERRARGVKMMREVTAAEPPPVADPYMEFTADAVFGDVWTRPGLTRKERRWISLTCAAAASAQPALQGHMTAALRSGDITPEEMIEWCIHFAHYAGWPRSASAYTLLGGILKDLGLAPKPRARARSSRPRTR
jgi:4-carboxymuconolactone decarboxylase